MRTHLKDVLLMWLLLVGVQLLYGVLMIPVVLLLLVIGGMFGGGVGLLIYVTSQSIIAAVIVGVVILFFLMGLPSLFIEGVDENLPLHQLDAGLPGNRCSSSS